MSLTVLHNNIKQCHKCDLRNTIPETTTPVPGTGNIYSKIMLVGEAPGKDEQLLGEPFVGLAGQFLNKILNNAGINRKECYITNIVCCNPRCNNDSKNRPPTDTEISACKLWLWQQIQIVNPEIIITLGAIATKTLLNSVINKSTAMNKIIGKIFEVTYCNSIFVPCYHPSFLMLHGKKHVEECVQILKMANKLVEENSYQK